jgi:putative two-component system response regulator
LGSKGSLGSSINKANVVAIDEDATHLAHLQESLKQAGFKNVAGFTDPADALQACSAKLPDLVVLDTCMPSLDGFSLLTKLRTTFASDQLPIVVFTEATCSETRSKALDIGASGFLTKPGEPTEIMLCVRNLLETKTLRQLLKNQSDLLSEHVQERTRDLEAARMEALERLARAAEFRDDDTGQHAKRVGQISARIAWRLADDETNPEILELAAPLHDIGKIGISDAILLKPNKLSHEEFEIMKTHTTIGAKILGGSSSPVLKQAAAIALTHHEKWDGTGYPLSLSGNQIPLAGRIVAIADVFDALTHERPYKRAWSQAQAVEYIKSRAGIEFDPHIVEAFCCIGRTTLLEEAA